MTRLAALAFALATSLALGCQNDTIELETDPGMPGDGDSTTTDPLDTTTGGDTPTTQTMLLAIHTIWSDTAFLQALVTSAPSGSSTDLTVQFLSLDMNSNTSPRQPVGDVYSYPGVAVDGNGGFVLDTGEITIVAAANPINGLDIVTTLVLTALPAGSPLCGDVTGNVTAPVVAVFDGSTHAMTTVPGVGDLPDPVVAACP